MMMKICRIFKGSKPAPTPKPSPEPKPVIGTVLYDPGHTSHRITNVSPPFADGTKIFEFATVRQIGDHANRMWRDLGFEVVDTSPPIEGPEDFNHRVSLANRATDEARALGRPVWFLSFHTNAVGSYPPVWRPDARGIEVFYFPGNERSRAAAVIIARHLHIATGWRLRWGDGAKAATFKVLRSTKADANLIEFGFHTNPTEAAALRDPSMQKIIAAATAAATAEIFATIANPLPPIYIPGGSITT